ncbi:intermembrane transport protein PqiB [Falsirhodobacter sp. alg1]|uniref:PqiB family protein n=1 Tax=Falsirhodobacter sp. alg1 TaxID=1472418 RepID=UPI00069344A1|nr:MlaD family protein [Falsirhodobacter sp. alg1]
MTDTPDSGPSEMNIRPAHKRIWKRISPVWIVPVLALIVAVVVAINSYTERGTLIKISFLNASGIEAGQTALRYRDVNIGTVEAVNFSPDLGRVVVSARVADDIAKYIDTEAQFWVVRPEVSVRGITGLSTVLSGAYISGQWDNTTSAERRDFEGLETPPLETQRGTTVTLRLKDGNQIAAGAPIIHKGIEVGAVGSPRLTDDGSGVLLDAVIEAPYDKLLTTDSRFWDASGFDVTLGASGIDLDVRSLAALIEGGINFDTIVSGGGAVEAGQEFQVFPNESQARSSVFTSDSQVELYLSILFDGSVSGLAENAEVRYHGLTVGRVTDLGAVAETDADGSPHVRMLANLAIDVSQLGLPNSTTADEAQEFIARLVAEDSLRARLATASLFTGSLMVELVEQPDTPATTLDTEHHPFALLPVGNADITEFQTTAQGVINRIGGLPIEDLMQSAIGALNSVQTLAGDPETRRVPSAAADLLSEARSLISGENVANILVNLRQTTDGLRRMSEQLEGGQAVNNLIAAIDKANTTLDGVQNASSDFPEIATQLRELAAKANTLPLEQLATSADGLVQSANRLLDNPDTQRVPGAVSDALSEVSRVLAEIREGGAITNANDAIAAAKEAADNVSEAVQGLPDLANRAAQLIEEAGTTVSGYGSDSRFNVELVTALRNLQVASEAVTSLARTIQRNPNSILLGR